MNTYSMQALNNVIFAEGNIQASPQEVAHLNSLPLTAYKPRNQGPVARGYKVFLSGYANRVYRSQSSFYYRDRLTAALDELNSNPRPVFGGYQKQNTADLRTYLTDTHKIQYKIRSGQVLVFNIELIDRVQKALDCLEKPALYHVKKNGNGFWERQEKVTAVNTKLAAVNGQSNNLTKATWLMASHLEFEFGKTEAVAEYTLFHNPSVGGLGDTWESTQDKFGFTTEVTKAFAKILQDGQTAGKPVKWVAHSQGGIIFAEAVRYHLNGNSSSTLKGIYNKMQGAGGGSLSHHSVAFHGNANNNFRSGFLFRKADINVISKRANHYDLVNVIIGMNSANPAQIVGSIVYSNHVLSGSPQQSPHTLMHDSYDAWNKQMVHGPGKGRNALQNAFHAADTAGRKAGAAVSDFFR